MDPSLFSKISEHEWMIAPFGKMRVPAIIFVTEKLLRNMDQKVYEQLANVASLPGIQKAAYAMPDAHWGYGFPIGGVAAFDPHQGGVISAGGVGFDISCGVRTLTTALTVEEIESRKNELADELFRTIPAGVGSTGRLRLNQKEMEDMLTGGAQWAVHQGYGVTEDLERTEEEGQMLHAKPSFVSEQSKKRQKEEVGTLGSGNHYLEVQKVSEIYNPGVADRFRLKTNHILVSIHCGSRGLGHQIGTEFLKKMLLQAPSFGITLPDRELACAPIQSDLGQEYLGAMRSAINCALANRQVITHLTREAFSNIFPKAQLELVYDVSHNTCKEEEHIVENTTKKLFVHRKGATRALGPGNPSIPKIFRDIGQPVLIGGSMGTASYILVGTTEGMKLSFGSACHGAGRSMSRHQATKQWKGRQLMDALASRGILIRSPSLRGVAEEAPGAYKDVGEVVDASHQAGIAHKVARLEPLICIKG